MQGEFVLEGAEANVWHAATNASRSSNRMASGKPGGGSQGEKVP